MTLRTATRRAFLYPSATATGETWADYANSVLDSLLAVEFRNAPSLAGATLYGSTPTAVLTPSGGFDLSAAGLTCVYADPTELNTGITPNSSYLGIVYCNVNASVTTEATPFGVQSGGRFWVQYGSGAGNVWQYGWGGGNSTTTGSSATKGTNVTLGLYSSQGYLNGVADGSFSVSWSTVTNTIAIGNRRASSNNYFWGVIMAVAIGTPKAGETGADIISELHTRMQTAAL